MPGRKRQFAGMCAISSSRLRRIAQDNLSVCSQNSRQILIRRPMPLADAGHVRGFELVTPPFVGAAVGGVILHVKKGITERRVPANVVSGSTARV